MKAYASPEAFKQAPEARIRKCATSDIGRFRQVLVFDRFLARVHEQFGERVIVKGGVVLELRVERARATRDIDLRLPGPRPAAPGETPGSIWTPSHRPFPKKIAPPEYPGHCEVRRVSNAGCFRLSAGQIFLSQALNGEYIALEEVDDGLWNIVYYNTLLGRFDQSTKRISGADFRTEPR